MVRCFATFALLMTLTMFGSARFADAADSVESDATKTFQSLVEEQWEYGLRESPTFASSLGDKRYNDKWPDLRPEAIETRHQHQVELLARIKTIDPKQLVENERLNYRLFRRQLENNIEQYPFHWNLVPLTQRDGLQDESDTAAAMTFTTVKDYEDWITRLRAFPEYGRQTIALMRRGIEMKLMQPAIVMRRVPNQIKKQLVTDPKDSLYYKPFRRMSDAIPAERQAELQKSAQDAIREHIVPFYKEFDAFFEKEYLPACYTSIGLWQAPRGDELYALRARQFTTTSMTPDEIHNVGLKEVARIRAEMEKVIKQTEFKGTFVEFLQDLRNNKKYYYESADDLLAGYQVICKRIDPELPKLFRRLPRIPYGVEAIPMHVAPDTTTAYYRQPAADGSRAGTYFVNLYKPESRPKYEMEALTLHESVPGHHLQIALSTELTNLPPFRRHSGFTAFTEGWGLYAESLGADLGCYRDPYSKFGQLTYEMWRAVRLVVDTGMHSKKWSRDRAIKFFLDNTAKSELDITNEVDRYITWPGQALAYKIGELKIKELRARATKQLGDRFDIREFHDVILREGAIPLDVLEEIVDAWLVTKVQIGEEKN